MTCLRAALFVFLSLASFAVNAQTTRFIGTSEEFILENVKGYASVEERGIEHEEFNVLVFEDKGREMSFYFTFYRGEKICSYIKYNAPLPVLKDEIDFIKTNFTNASANIWENAAKTVQVRINTTDNQGLIVVKELRN